MLKKQSYINQQLIIATFFVIISACSPKNQQTQINCNEDINSCISIANDHLAVTINTPKIIVENQYQLTIKSDQVINKVYLESINMNMGQIPIMIDMVDTLTEQKSNPYVYQGLLQLGMCAEEIMQWHLVIQSETATHQFKLTSYWR